MKSKTNKVFMIIYYVRIIFQGQNKLIVLLTEPLTSDDNVVITVDKNGHKIEVMSVTRRNPYTLQFKMPRQYIYTILNITVTINLNQWLYLKFGHSELFASIRLGKRDRREKWTAVGSAVGQMRESYEGIGSTDTFVGQSAKFFVPGKTNNR